MAVLPSVEAIIHPEVRARAGRLYHRGKKIQVLLQNWLGGRSRGGIGVTFPPWNVQVSDQYVTQGSWNPGYNTTSARPEIQQDAMVVMVDFLFPFLYPPNQAILKLVNDPSRCHSYYHFRMKACFNPPDGSILYQEQSLTVASHFRSCGPTQHDRDCRREIAYTKDLGSEIQLTPGLLAEILYTCQDSLLYSSVYEDAEKLLPVSMG